ncbi:MAG TPA: hypothetical protein VEJ20_08070 [Candidatus Eremiobacteraceae bacterium]|nr:hypothetical protein [Candidatus Eremiobacteraceae bacterium]
MNTDRTFVLRLYKISNGELVCSVTDVASGERWVADATPELERLLRLQGEEKSPNARP